MTRDEIAQEVNYQLKCRVCGTAAYQPNERCRFHLSDAQRADMCETEREQSNAWRKRATEAEQERDALAAEIAGLRAALEGVRCNYCGYVLNGVSNPEGCETCAPVVTALRGTSDAGN